MTTAVQNRSDAGLATALRISVSRLARRLRVERIAQGQGDHALSDTQLAALAALERHEAMSPGELAEHEKVQPPSMTRVIAALEAGGLVTRMPHPTDRRQVVLTVTTVAGVTWAAARVYRVGILMYGKRATFPEIVRWARMS